MSFYNSLTNETTVTGNVTSAEITMIEESEPANTFSTTQGKIYKKTGDSSLYYKVGGGVEQSLTGAGSTVASSLTTTGAAVNIAASAPPVLGDQLVATSATTATWQAAGGGSGDVVGPAFSIDNTLPRFSGTTGKLIQGSGVFVDDLAQISGAPKLTMNTALDVKKTVLEKVNLSNKMSLTDDIIVPGAGTSYAMSLAGVEYIDFGDVTAFEHNLPFSVETWFKTVTSAAMPLISKRVSIGPADPGWELKFISNNNRFQIYISNDIVTNVIKINYLHGAGLYNNGAWHHIAMTYNGNGLASGVTLYVDNVVQTPNVINDTLGGLSILSPISLQIGKRGSSTNTFIGELDESRIYSKMLSAAEINNHWNGGAGQFGLPEAGLVLGVHYDEGVGFACADYSGSGFNGTSTSNTWVTPGKVAVGGSQVSINVLSSQDGVAVGENGIVKLGDVSGTTQIDGSKISIRGNYTLPVADGIGGQALITDGSGALLFANTGTTVPATTVIDNITTWGNNTGGELLDSGVRIKKLGTTSLAIGSTNSGTAGNNLYIGSNGGANTGINNTCLGIGSNHFAALNNTISIGKGVVATKANQCMIGGALQDELITQGINCELGTTANPWEGMALRPKTTVSLPLATAFKATIKYDDTLGEPVYSDGATWKTMGGGGGGAATDLASATTIINIDSAAAPTVNQILTATSGTTATWQDLGGSASNKSNLYMIEDTLSATFVSNPTNTLITLSGIPTWNDGANVWTITGTTQPVMTYTGVPTKTFKVTVFGNYNLNSTSSITFGINKNGVSHKEYFNSLSNTQSTFYTATMSYVVDLATNDSITMYYRTGGVGIGTYSNMLFAIEEYDNKNPTIIGTALPTTTKGDLLSRDASTDTRVAIGTDGQFLTADSVVPSGMKWTTITTGDVNGPPSAVDSNLAAFDTTTGKLLKDSLVGVSTYAGAVGEPSIWLASKPTGILTSSAQDNVFTGALSGKETTTAQDCCGYGVGSLQSNQSGNFCTSYGSGALFSNVTANALTAYGFQSLVLCTSGNSTAVGNSSGSSITTGNGLFLGHNANGAATAAGQIAIAGTTTKANQCMIGGTSLVEIVTDGTSTNLGTVAKPFLSLGLKNVTSATLPLAAASGGLVQYSSDFNAHAFCTGVNWISSALTGSNTLVAGVRVVTLTNCDANTVVQVSRQGPGTGTGAYLSVIVAVGQFTVQSYQASHVTSADDTGEFVWTAHMKKTT